MTCVLLAAGYATRLYPLTKNAPKALLRVAGKTVLDRVMENVDNGCEIDRYVLVTNSRFHEHFNAWTKSAAYSRPVEVLDDGTDTVENRRGAVGDLLFAVEQLRLHDDLFVLAVDYFVDFHLGEFSAYFREKETSCILRYEEHEKAALQKAAAMTVDGSDLVLRMEEKPQEPFDIWCAPPFYIYSVQDLPLIRDCLRLGCSKDAPGSLAAWLSQHRPVHAMCMPGRHYDIGDLESYERIQKLFQNQ